MNWRLGNSYKNMEGRKGEQGSKKDRQGLLRT